MKLLPVDLLPVDRLEVPPLETVVASRLADLAVEIATRRKAFERSANVYQSLHLRSHHEIAVFVTPLVERDHTYGIAGNQIAIAIEIVKNKSEDSVEIVEKLGTLLSVEAKDEFAIRARFGLEYRSQPWFGPTF